MENIFFEITIVISVAAALTILFRVLKQPPILAYILTGILLGPLGLFHIQDHEALKTLGQLGVTLSLFMLGLELRLGELRSIGKTAIILGTLQMITTYILGFILALILGFSEQVATYIGIGLSFSSTIIIVKLLSDKHDLTSLHGKLSIGLLLVQDFFAVITIIFLTGVHPGAGVTILPQILFILLKVVFLFGSVILLSKYVFPKIVHTLADSPEAFFLFSLAWVFSLTALVSSRVFGFSLEIGGFLAGLALANASENYQIVARMKALRDFFITIFFVMLGFEMKLTNFTSVLFPVLVLSAFVIVIKPLLTTIIVGLMGFRKRTALFVGLSTGQVSEFSLIILFLGGTLHVVPPNVITIMVLVAVITFATSSYTIKSMNSIYKKIHHYFDGIERQKTNAENSFSATNALVELDDHVIVIGADQMGRSIIRALEESEEKVIVVDFNPDIVKRLSDKGNSVLFGDIADPDIQERAKIEKAKMVISTVPDVEDNLLLIKSLNHTNRRAKIVVMAYEVGDAKILYKAGADYVILPHLAGGRHLAKILLDKNHLKLIEDYKAKDLSDLR